jgi:hypothetical protein
LVPGVAPRLNQKALALLSIVDDEGARERIAGALVREEARTLSERASSLEATVLTAICEVAPHADGAGISVAAVAGAVSRKISGSLHVPITPKAVGFVIRTRLRLATVKSHGIYVIPNTERGRIAVLAARYGVASEAAAGA